MFNSLSFQGLLLLVQAALIVWLFSGQAGGVSQQHEQQPLISIQSSAFNRITIDDNDNNKVLMKKQEGRWILPDYHNLAVNQGLLDQTLEHLTTARTGWPVAQTADAAERFLVSPEKFRRQLRLQAEADAVEEFYLGDSPGLRKIYIRKNNEQAIYAIEFGLHLAPARAEQWFDKGLLKPQEQIKAIYAADFTLLKQGDDWDMKDLDEMESLDQDKIINLVNYLQYPQVQAVAAEAVVNNLQKLEPIVEYRVKTGDMEIIYELFNVDEQYILKSSLSDLYFTVADFAKDAIAGIQRDALISKLIAETASTEEDSGRQQDEQTNLPPLDTSSPTQSR